MARSLIRFPRPQRSVLGSSAASRLRGPRAACCGRLVAFPVRRPSSPSHRDVAASQRFLAWKQRTRNGQGPLQEKLRIPIAPASGLGPRPPVRAARCATIGRGECSRPILSLSAGDDVVDDPVGFGLLGGRSVTSGRGTTSGSGARAGSSRRTCCRSTERWCIHSTGRPGLGRPSCATCSSTGTRTAADRGSLSRHSSSLGVHGEREPRDGDGWSLVADRGKACSLSVDLSGRFTTVSPRDQVSARPFVEVRHRSARPISD